MAASATPLMIEESFNVDKLTSDIFSILENKFLFGSSVHDSNHFLSAQKSHILDETFFTDLKSNQNITGKVRILSIDAGGSTDGILAAKSLTYVEACLCQKSGNPDARVADFFDVVAGSGVGGILAALLFTKGEDSRPIFKAEEALQFLIKNHQRLAPSSAKKGVFKKIFHSSSKATKKLFCKTFGESTLKDTMKPVLIPCYDLSTRAPFLFSRADAFETDGYDFKMSDVCAATSADPTLEGAFELHSVDKSTRIMAIDGCLAMNNPTAAAITHVLNNKQEFPFCDGVEDLLVVSLGNGVPSSNRRGSILSPANLVQIGGEGASDMVDQAVSMAFGGIVTSNYVRIQANGFKVTKNSKSSSSTEELVWAAESMLTDKNIESVLFRGKKIVEKTNSDKLELFAGKLIEEHERRKSSILPTVVFRQSSPRTSSATVSTISSY